MVENVHIYVSKWKDQLYLCESNNPYFNAPTTTFMSGTYPKGVGAVNKLL
jgi:hypothetical protein